MVIVRNIKEGTFEVNFMVKMKEMFVHDFFWLQRSGLFKRISIGSAMCKRWLLEALGKLNVILYCNFEWYICIDLTGRIDWNCNGRAFYYSSLYLVQPWSLIFWSTVVDLSHSALNVTGFTWEAKLINTH